MPQVKVLLKLTAASKTVCELAWGCYARSRKRERGFSKLFNGNNTFLGGGLYT